MTQLPIIKRDFEAMAIRHEGPGGRWERTITLPARGRFVEESHYVTNQDSFSAPGKFPSSNDDKIQEHLKRSLEIYKKYNSSTDFDDLYGNNWEKVWTPSEGGNIGQGSVGDIQLQDLSPEMEMWFMTMMWASGEKPHRGTKFLLSANNRHVVVIAGYETGPGDKKFIGGITPEVHAWLGTDNNSSLNIKYLKDQNVPIGPVKLFDNTETDGEKIIELALKHLNETYIFGARAPMNNPNWKGPWDCAEFVSWCIYQTTGILYGTEPKNDPHLADAYTGYWAKQAKLDVAYISIEKAAQIPGACILRKPRSDRSGHIVFSDGEGGTIEAHGSNRGVIRHTLNNRRWDTGILVPGLRYVMNDEPVNIITRPHIIIRLTNPMMRGPIVKEIQEELVRRGYHPGKIDSIYGPQTESAVISFQSDIGIVPDGEVGKLTFAALEISEI